MWSIQCELRLEFKCEREKSGDWLFQFLLFCQIREIKSKLINKMGGKEERILSSNWIFALTEI